MTPSEAQAQLDRLDERLGKDRGAVSERRRLREVAGNTTKPAKKLSGNPKGKAAKVRTHG